jgi:hypothetical protein
MTETAVKSMTQDFIAFQQAVGPIFKDSKNPHFGSKYAKLEDVIAATYEALNANNFAVTQLPRVIKPVDSDPYMVLVSQLRHTSGDLIESEHLIVAKDYNNPQQIGSAITYARRYALLAMTGLAPEDDDGNAAVSNGTATAPKKSTVATSPKTDTPVASSTKQASDKQKDYILSLLGQKLGITDPDKQLLWIEDQTETAIDDLMSAQASSIVEQLKDLPNAAKGKKAPAEF